MNNVGQTKERKETLFVSKKDTAKDSGDSVVTRRRERKGYRETTVTVILIKSHKFSTS